MDSFHGRAAVGGKRSPTKNSKSFSTASSATSSDEKDADVLLQQLEVLVDELIKDHPHEERIRDCMHAAGLTYMTDSIGRMNLVLSALDRVRIVKSKKKCKSEEQEL